MIVQHVSTTSQGCWIASQRDVAWIKPSRILTSANDTSSAVGPSEDIDLGRLPSAGIF